MVSTPLNGKMRSPSFISISGGTGRLVESGGGCKGLCFSHKSRWCERWMRWWIILLHCKHGWTIWWRTHVMAWLVYMPENCRDMCVDPMMGSGGLPEGRLGEVGPRIEAGEPLEGRSSSNKEVSMSHGHSEQDLDYLACWPIPAQSTQCRRRVPTWKAAQPSLDASVSMTIVQWLMISQGDE